MTKTRNRLVDLRCAWEKGDDVEREKFLQWICDDDQAHLWPQATRIKPVSIYNLAEVLGDEGDRPSTYINCACGARYMRKRGECPECHRAEEAAEEPTAKLADRAAHSIMQRIYRTVEPPHEVERPRDCDKCGRRLLPVEDWGNSQYLYLCEECARVEAPHQFTLAAQVKEHLDEGAAKRRREQEGQED